MSLPADQRDEVTHALDEPGRTNPSAVPTHDGSGATVNTGHTTAVESPDQPTGDIADHIDRATKAAARARVKSDPFIGMEIRGQYVIDSKIGEGGMGAVYRGMQTSMGRPVAIKVLLRNLVKQDKFVRRFENEARAVSRLQHPNTIRIFDFGQVDESTLFIAMEFLDGLPLQRVLRKEGVLPVRRALHVIRQCAQSLAEAHKIGIVHRDLKPDNLFVLSVGDDDWFVKLLDFGVAKFDDPAANGELTQTHMILGTPKYMAPEQARGKNVDARSDLYSLGVIAYELMTGKAPFSGDAMTVLYKQVHDTPPPMTERAPEIFVPPAVEKLVMALMAKRAEDRIQSAKALADTIEAFLKELPDDFDHVIRRDPSGNTAIVDLPESLGDTALIYGGTQTSSGVQTIALPTRSNRWRWPAAAAGAIAVGATLYFSFRADPPVTRLPDPPPSSAGMSLPALALSTPQAKHVSVKLTSKPFGAEIWRGDERLGTAPLEFERGVGAEAETLRVVFGPGKQKVVQLAFDKSGEIVAELPAEAPPVVPPPVADLAKQPDSPPTNPTVATDSPPGPDTGSDTEDGNRPPGKQPGTKRPTGGTGKRPNQGTTAIAADPDEGKVVPPKPPVDTGRVSPLK